MKFKSGDKYVDVFVEDFRTRVRLPAPPPFSLLQFQELGFIFIPGKQASGRHMRVLFSFL
jgi:hypothetical protein